MKKLLLFTLSMSMVGLSYAQKSTLISVDDILQPSAVVYVGDSNPQSIIEVTMTNNDTLDFLAPSINFISFVVTLDNVPLSDPDANAWSRPLTFDFNSGASTNFILNQAWESTKNVGSYELCIGVSLILSGTTLYTNVNSPKTFCKTLSFEHPVGIEGVQATEISTIKMVGDLMTVYVKNVDSQIQVNIMNITGQVVKTVVPSVTGQNFYQDINISDLTPGVYIVSIQTENGIAAAKKVFIQ